MPVPHHSVFTGWMPFLPPNKQLQSTEGMYVIIFKKESTLISWLHINLKAQGTGKPGRWPKSPKKCYYTDDFAKCSLIYIPSPPVVQHLSNDVCLENTTRPHQNRFTVLFPGPSGWAGARRELLDLWCKGRLTEADTLTIRLGVTPYFFTGWMPFLLPNQQCQSTEGNFV